MASLINRIIAKLKNKEYRESYLDASINDVIASQIFNLRKDNGYTQTKLANLAKMAQPRIALLEKSEYKTYSISTLKRLAHAFDVALIVKFVPFSELVDFNANFSSKDVHIDIYDKDSFDWIEERGPGQIPSTITEQEGFRNRGKGIPFPSESGPGEFIEENNKRRRRLWI